MIPHLGEQPLDIGLGLICVSEHFQVSPAVLTGEHIRLHLTDRSLLLQECFANNVHPEIGLNHQSRCLLHHAFLSLEVGPSHESLDGRLDQDEAVTSPLVVEAGFEAAENPLDVHHEVVLCVLKDLTCI